MGDGFDQEKAGVLREGFAEAARQDGATTGQVAKVGADGQMRFGDAGGGSQPFSGCRYSIQHPEDGSGITATNLIANITTKNAGIPIPFYDTDAYALEGFDGDGFFNGSHLTIPADGYYRVTANVSCDFNNGSDSTFAEIIIGSSRDSEWDTSDHQTIGKTPNPNAISDTHSVTHWFAEGDSVLLTLTRDGSALLVRAAIEVEFVGAGTNPAA